MIGLRHRSHSGLPRTQFWPMRNKGKSRISGDKKKQLTQEKGPGPSPLLFPLSVVLYESLKLEAVAAAIL